MLTDLNQDVGRAAAKEIGDTAIFVTHDISDEENWKAVIAATQQHFGRVDGLVNNAGVLLMASVEDTTIEQWRQVLRVNSDGYFLGCKYGVAAMKSTGGGSIVNMSSVAASGLPFAAAYSASKGSVAALTNSVAIHCRSAGYRIRCNSIHPDGVLTPTVLPLLGNSDPKAVGYDADPTTRFCDPSDVANLVLFLLSLGSSAVRRSESLTLTEAKLVADDTIRLEADLDGGHHTLACGRQEVLLTAMLRAGLKAPHSCRMGECGTCMCILLEGKVHLRANDVLSPADLEEGWILACQAIADTPAVKVRFPD